MTKQKFQRLMNMAKTFQKIDSDRSEYWAGFQRGLRRNFHGENFGTEDEHEKWMNPGDHRKQLGTGYRAGFYFDQLKIENQADIQPLRKLLNLSTANIAEIALVSHRTVEGWEQGREMSDSVIMLLKKHFMI